MRYLVLLLLLAGCAYTSHTTIKANGTDLKSPYLFGKNINAVIEREMTFNFLR